MSECSEKPNIAIALSMLGKPDDGRVGRRNLNISGSTLAELYQLRELSCLWLINDLDISIPEILGSGLIRYFSLNNLICANEGEALLRTLADEGLIYVGPTPPLINVGNQMVYVPGIEMVYGALAGEEIILAAINYDLAKTARSDEGLATASITRLHAGYPPGDCLLSYTCTSSKERLLNLGFDVIEIASMDVILNFHLFTQDIKSKPPIHRNFEIYSNRTLRIVAIRTS